jgi:hypothetical protein
VLSAYVRGCGGTTEEWEERWRSLTRTPALPVPAARHAGNSAAATAGARIGTATQVADAPDPSIIIAALNRVAEEMAGGPDTPKVPFSDPPRPAYPDDSPPAGALPQPSGPASAASAVFPDSPFGGPASGLEAGTAAGWDPIRVSSAWPAIGSESAQGTRAPDDTTPMDAPPWEAPDWEVPPWESASWAAEPAGSASHGETVTAVPEVIMPTSVTSPAAAPESIAPESGPAAPGADRLGAGRPASASAQRADREPAGRGTRASRASIRQSAWAGDAGSPSEADGATHPGSRARTVMLVVVLACVLAVLLAIFA